MKNINDYKYKTVFYINTDGDFCYDTEYEVEEIYTKTLESARELIEYRLNEIIDTLIIPESKKYIDKQVTDLLDRAKLDFKIYTDSNMSEYWYEGSNGNYDIEMAIEEVITELSREHFID